MPTIERINTFLVRVMDVVIFLPPPFRHYSESIARDAYVYAEYYCKYNRRNNGNK